MRPAQHIPVGRERAFLRRKGVLGDISLHKLCGPFVFESEVIKWHQKNRWAHHLNTEA
nr:MAG TPA: hypothetical protein [Caudoviricetes sp.]